MIKLNNPYTQYPEFHCFACDPSHKTGLRMNFWLEDKKMVSEWMPQADFQGFYQIVHGGIQATLSDEIAGWVVQVICKTTGVTTELNVKYLKPMMLSNGPVRIEAWLDHQQGNKAMIKVEITDRQGTLCTIAEVIYHLFDEKISREKFYYPGHQAFVQG